MIESACFGGGELSCLSCHSMHGYEQVNHQMAPGMLTDQACLQCHAEFEERIEEHTHHPRGSSGSTCVNCHMPYTVWGLLEAMRSHWINSPSVRSSLETGRPNACNACHLDRSLGWSALHLEDWYGQARPELESDQAEISAALLWILSGHAGQRGLIAWHMGWEPAHEASGTDWMAPFLANTMLDDYAAVRHAGSRSLRTLPGYETFEYDYVRPEERAQAVRSIARDWRLPARGVPGDREAGAIPRLLIDEDGALQVPTLLRLIQGRDDRRVVLEE
jgi:hypothetical protein